MSNRIQPPPPGVATAWGLVLALLLIAVVAAVSAFWTHHTVIATPDGPAVVQIDRPAPTPTIRKALR